MAVQVKEEWWENVLVHKELNERLMYVKVETGRDTSVTVLVYAPQAQENEERDRGG